MKSNAANSASLKVFAVEGDEMGATITELFKGYSLVKLETDETAILLGATGLPKGTNIRVRVAPGTDNPHAVYARSRKIVVRMISTHTEAARLVKVDDVVTATVVNYNEQKKYCLLSLETGERAVLLGHGSLTPGIEITVKVSGVRVELGLRKVTCKLAEEVVVSEEFTPSRLVQTGEMVAATIIRVNTVKQISSVILETGEEAALMCEAGLGVGTTIKVVVYNIRISAYGKRIVYCSYEHDAKLSRMVTEGEEVDATVVRFLTKGVCILRLETSEVAILLQSRKREMNSSVRVKVVGIKMEDGRRKIACHTIENAARFAERARVHQMRASPVAAAEALFKKPA